MTYLYKFSALTRGEQFVTIEKRATLPESLKIEW